MPTQRLRSWCFIHNPALNSFSVKDKTGQSLHQCFGFFYGGTIDKTLITYRYRIGMKIGLFNVYPYSRLLVPFRGIDVGEASEPLRRAREASPTRELELICQADIQEIE